MYVVNRSALIVKLKKPYLDWINYVSDPHKYTLETINREHHVFLIPEHDTEDALEEIIEEMYMEIFDHELESFSRDRTLWPKKQNLAMFREWFDVQVHSMVLDACEEEIMEEEW